MKTRLLIPAILFIMIGLHVSAQSVKKQPKKHSDKKKVTTNTKQTAQSKAPVNNQPQAKAAGTDLYYANALGLKFIYGISLTGKHFINDKAAIEAIVRYRDYSFLGSELNLSALYEYHGNIEGAPGLRWYGGGGAYLGYFSYDNNIVADGSAFTAGVSGIVGLEYKIKNVPLAVSLDWQPVFILNGNSGFTAENGGIGVKYAF